MKQQIKTKVIFILTTVILAFVNLLIIVISSGAANGRVTAFAQSDVIYTDVVSDLQRDETFDVAAYPAVPNDYSLQVIQIAESSGGELFIYVYQPAAGERQLMATEINMALAEEVTGTALYKLTFLNSDGVFFKYLVNDVSVISDKVRYYNISAIYRSWVEECDGKPDGENTGNAKAYGVGKLFIVHTVNDEILYECEEKKVIDILSPYTGFIRYKDGVSGIFHFVNDFTDSHFIAFDANYKIDELYAVQVSFYLRPKQTEIFSGSEPVYFYTGEPEFQNIVLSDKDKGFTTPSGWKKYDELSFDRIQSVAAFINDAQNHLSSEMKDILQDKQWVLRFYETKYVEHTNVSHVITTIESTDISEVTILRLHFKSNGIVYNLGAVSDKITEGKTPDNENSEFDFFQWLADLLGVSRYWAKVIFWCVVGCLVLAIAMPVLSLVFPTFGELLKRMFIGIWTGIKYLFIGLWWVVSLPFRGIAALNRKIKGGD